MHAWPDAPIKVCNLLHVTYAYRPPFAKKTLSDVCECLHVLCYCGLNNLSNMSIFIMCKYSIYMFAFFGVTEYHLENVFHVGMCPFSLMNFWNFFEKVSESFKAWICTVVQNMLFLTCTLHLFRSLSAKLSLPVQGYGSECGAS